MTERMLLFQHYQLCSSLSRDVSSRQGWNSDNLIFVPQHQTMKVPRKHGDKYSRPVPQQWLEVNGRIVAPAAFTSRKILYHGQKSA
jgi:hypothetical protein